MYADVNKLPKELVITILSILHNDSPDASRAFMPPSRH